MAQRRNGTKAKMERRSEWEKERLLREETKYLKTGLSDKSFKGDRNRNTKKVKK